MQLPNQSVRVRWTPADASIYPLVHLAAPLKLLALLLTFYAPFCTASSKFLACPSLHKSRMMRSDSDKSQGSPRGGSDSWHNGGRGSEATTHSATIGLNPLPASPPARYRTQQHHDADHPGASNTEVSLWGRRRGPLGTVQQTPPYPPPQPPHPAHPAHQACLEHQAAPRDDFVFGAFGAALAARIHFPPHRTEPSSNKKTRGRAASQPKHGDNPRVQQRRVTDGTPKLRQISNGSNRSRPIGKPALPPDQPLLDVPMAEGTEPDMLFEAYRDSREFSQRAKDYWLQVGSLHHMFDVFDWWFYRVRPSATIRLSQRLTLNLGSRSS